MLASPALEVAALGESFRLRVDEALLRFLGERRREVSSLAPDAAVLVDELIRLVRSGGKRLRPLFCYWGFRAAGGVDGDGIVRAGAALELLHAFAIVHDDLIDGSPARRGQPTTQAAMATRAGLSPRAAWGAAVLV